MFLGYLETDCRKPENICSSKGVAVNVAQLAKQSLLATEELSLNPVIRQRKIFSVHSLEKTKINIEKEVEIGPFQK